MQTLMNIALGAMLAGASLGPAAWADVAQAKGRIVQAVSILAGLEEAGPAHGALPSLPHGAR